MTETTMTSVRVAREPWRDAGDETRTERCHNPECEDGMVYRWANGKWTTPGFAELGVAFDGPYRKPSPCPDCRGTGRVDYWGSDA